MSSRRKAIRHAVKDLLAGNTSVDQNVFTNRETNLWEAELPAILIYTSEENASPRDITGRRSIYTMALTIECKVMGDENVDDSLDDLTNEVRELMKANLSLNGTATGSVYQGTKIIIDPSSETEKGIAILTFEITYID